MDGSAKARLSIAGAVAALLAAAASAFAFAAGGAADDGATRITMTDGAIAIESSQLPAGRRVVEAVNEGRAEHELVVLRTSKPADALPVGLHGVSIRQAGELVIGEDHLASRHEHEPGTVLGLLPGESQRHQVDLKPGSYVVYCQTGSHYLAGERTSFTVE